MKSFLGMVASQKSIDLLRRRRTVKKAGVHSLENVDVAAQSDSPDSRLQYDDLLDQIRDGLTELPMQESQAFCLRFINDMSYREIAEHMDITENYVGVLISRARGKLKILLSTRTADNGREVTG